MLGKSCERKKIEERFYHEAKKNMKKSRKDGFYHEKHEIHKRHENKNRVGKVWPYTGFSVIPQSSPSLEARNQGSDVFPHKNCHPSFSRKSTSMIESATESVLKTHVKEAS
jgi:hypothetical protein